MTDYPEIELASAGKHGGGSGCGPLFKLEARTSSSMSTVLASDEHFPLILDHCWREIPIRLGATKWGTNIPIHSWDADGAKHGCVSYEAVEAHRWAFIAWLEATKAGGALCVETRLVEVKFSWSYKIEEIGVSMPLKEVVRSKPIFRPRAERVAGTMIAKAEPKDIESNA